MSNTDDDVAQCLFRIAASASYEEAVEEQNFSSIVAATRQNFRRDLPRVQRGRKRKLHFSASVFLMKLAHAEFGPGKAESHFLKSRGLGLANDKLNVLRSSSLLDMKASIIRLYPQNIQSLLSMCDFKMGKLTKSRKIELLENILTGDDLEGQLKQSMLIILPLKDFPSNLPHVIPNGNASALQRRNNTRPSTPQSPTTRVLDDDSDFSRQNPRSRAITVPRFVDIIEEEELDEEEIMVVHEINENVVMIPEISASAEKIIVSISRQNCLIDLLSLYEDDTITKKNLTVEFLGEPGIDGGGLTKELFNIFFSQCMELYFREEECLVSHLELNKLKDIGKFVIIGRILQHMLLITQTVPSKLSKITLILIGNPKMEVDDDIQLQELLNYVNNYLRKVIKKAVKNYSSLTEKENEIIADFFTSSHFWARPSADSIKEQLLIIASDILIEKPKKFILKMRQGVAPQNYPNFWNNCNFSVLIDMQTLTETKIVNCLQTDDNLTNEQNSILHYFTMFINCLEKDQLLELVFLITGSFVMPDFIAVKFNDFVGLQQRPSFSTCTNTITLPESFSSYTELKKVLTACINSDEAREYTCY